MKVIVWIMIGLFAVGLILCGISSYVLGQPILSGLFAVWAIFLVTNLIGAVNRFSTTILSATLCISIVVMALLSATDLTVQMRQIGDRVISEGPETLSFGECVGLWWTVPIMSAGGLISGFRHVSMENFLLLIPKENEIHFNDDFALGSKKVRKYVDVIIGAKVCHCSGGICPAVSV